MKCFAENSLPENKTVFYLCWHEEKCGRPVLAFLTVRMGSCVLLALSWVRMGTGVSFDSMLGLRVEPGASLGSQSLSPCGAEMWIWMCFLGGA